jgi:hypothetical protein
MPIDLEGFFISNFYLYFSQLRSFPRKVFNTTLTNVVTQLLRSLNLQLYTTLSIILLSLLVHQI